MITSAVIFDSNFIYQWQLNTISKLIDNESAHIEEFVILNRVEMSVSFLSKAFFERGSANKRISKESISQYAQERKIKVVQIDHVDDFIDITVVKKELFSSNYNFILDFTALPIKGDTISLCKWGYWKLKFSEQNKISNDPVGYNEIKSGKKIIHAQLVVIKSGSLSYLGKEICVGTFRFSYLKTFKKLIYHTNYLIDQMINSFTNQSELDRPIDITYAYKSIPNSFQTLYLILRQLLESVRFFWERAFFTDKWNIGYINKPIESFLGPIDHKDIIWIDYKKKNKFIADPFIFRSNGSTRLIYEELDYSEGVGYINSAEIENDKIVNENTIFKTTSHFSYPFIIHHENEVYCVPETSEDQEIALYKLDQSSNNWLKLKVLVSNFRGIDNTVLFHNGLWWLFTTKAKNRPHEIVYLYYSSSLEGEWAPHANNPIKIDIRSARGAGTPFISAGALYRPAQDYSEEIEGRIRLNKIVKLSTSAYEEREVCIINPFNKSDFPHKIHTLCDAGSFTVIDGCRKVFILRHPGFIFFKVKRIYNFILRYISRYKH
jgi:hypothetical protein